MCSRSFDHFSLSPHVFLTSDTAKYVSPFSLFHLMLHNHISLQSPLQNPPLQDSSSSTRYPFSSGIQFSWTSGYNSLSIVAGPVTLNFSVPQVGLNAFTIKDLEKSFHSSSPLHSSSLHSLQSSSLSIPPRTIPPR